MKKDKSTFEPILVKKVSEYQKQFFLNLYFPKTNEMLYKILPYEAKYWSWFGTFFEVWAELKNYLRLS